MSAAEIIVLTACILACLYYRFLRVSTSAERVWRERREELEASRTQKLDISTAQRRAE